MTADMSVAPEIARLAEALVLVPASPAAGLRGPGQLDVPGARLTLGTLSGRLRMIAATPERWWSLVRFEPDRPVTITIGHLGAIDGDPGYQAWLMVLPPGDHGQPCDCDVATMVAGEAIEGADTSGADASGANASTILRPGPVRVHGQPHWLRGRGTGYSISLHARAYGKVRIS